jgi:glutathione synthase
MALKLVFIMDPIASINIRGDSTFVLMLESQARGHEVLYAQPKNLELRGGVPWVECQHATMQRVEGDHFRVGPSQWVSLNDLDAVFVRKDPPFDVDYLISTYILDHADRTRVVFVNDPQGVRDFNEKLSAFYFAELMPETIVTTSAKRIREFIEAHGAAVIKPLTLSGGTGVILLAHGDKNTGSVIDLLTREGRAHVEVQQFLEKVTDGDKRIVLLDGAPIGAINRRPRSDDLRANMHVGGTAEASKLTAREQVICARLGPELSRRGLVFVGIDVIDGRLTEVNVTSPTGLQEIGRFDGVSLEAQYIDWVEQKRASLTR